MEQPEDRIQRITDSILHAERVVIRGQERIERTNKRIRESRLAMRISAELRGDRSEAGFD